MSRVRLWSSAFLIATLWGLPLAPVHGAEQKGAGSNPVLSVEGRVKHPQHFDAEALRKLPAETVQVSFQTERGPLTGSFTGVRLWTLLGEAGGLDDPVKGAELHHLIKITGQDGYWIVISTGEIAPDFGAGPALIAYQREGAPLGATGFRLVIPGDKHGGRSVRDVIAVTIE